MKTVVCVWWGDKFSVDYVYNLKAMVERNTTVPFRFVCYSDKDIPGIETKRLKPGVEGWWNKLQMFDPAMKVGDYVLYFDLDTIITGNIDWLMNYDTWFMGIEDVGAVNAHQPHLKNVLQTGVMTWDHDANSHIYLDFLMNYDRIKNQFRGDGEYLNTKINPYHRKLLQHVFPGKLKSYKYDIYPGPPKEDVSIVCFHGRPSIIQAMEETVVTPVRAYEPQKWIKDYWYH
jgi:hypothetical protein